MSENHLIIIDDEEGFRDVVARIARRSGFEPFATDDADAFLNHVRSHQIDIIIIDLHMPRVDGVHILRDLSALGTSAKILLASGEDPRIVQTAFHLGQERGLRMAGIIHKPIRAAELRSLLEQHHPRHSAVTSETLGAAIHSDALVLHYQPCLDLKSGDVVGVEALVRWPHSKLGMIMPNDFVLLAERSELINDLTDWTFLTGIRQCGEWHRRGLRLGMSLNLSARSVCDVDLPDRVMRLCHEHSVSTTSVTIELTETASMQDVAMTMDVLTRFRLKGFHLSIDDFGTGYSSLVQLQRLPFSEMKIDRSFVMGMETGECEIIVKTIIGMARNMGLASVAEGVENDQVLGRLRSWGCDRAQGFGIARPMLPEDLMDFLYRRDRSRSASSAHRTI